MEDPTKIFVIYLPENLSTQRLSSLRDQIRSEVQAKDISSKFFILPTQGDYKLELLNPSIVEQKDMNKVLRELKKFDKLFSNIIKKYETTKD